MNTKSNLLKSIFISLILLMGVNNAWAGNATIYVTGHIFKDSWDASKSEVRIGYNYDSNDGKSGNDNWTGHKSMTLTQYTYNGYPIYSYNVSSSTNWAQIFFYHYKNGQHFNSQQQNTGGWTEFTNNNNKVYVGWIENDHRWVELCEDNTFYFLKNGKAANWTKLYAYAWSGSVNNNWPGTLMSNTGKTYNGTTIYSVKLYCTYATIIFNKGDGTNQSGNQATPGHEEKIFDYQNNNWLDYTYDVTVTFDANEHGTAPSAITVLKGNTVTAPTEPTAPGYIFEGWYKEAGCTNKWNFSTDVVNDNITLYAKWTKNITTYKVTYGIHSSGGGKLTATATGAAITSRTDVEENQTIVFTATPDQGYQVEGWYSDVDCTAKLGNGYSISNENKICTISKLAKTETVYVKFKENTFDVTVILNDAKGGTTEPSGLQSQIGQVTGMNIAARVNSGYQFIGWDFVSGAGTFGAANAASTTFKPSQESTIRANFKANQYTITWDADGGTVDPTTSTYTYDGDPVALPTPKREGYTFNGWYTEKTDGKPIDNIGKDNKPTSNVTYYAQWTANTYIVTLEQGSATTQGTTSVTATYDADMPSATMPTKTGYVFGGYYDQENGQGTQYYNANGASARTWNKTSATTLYAYFQKAEITGIAFDKGEVPEGGYVTFEPTIEPTPSGNTVICWELKKGETTIDNSYIIPVEETNNVKISIAELVAGKGKGIYTIKATLRTGTGCETGTELSSYETNFANTDFILSTPIYLKPSATWQQHDARFAIYYWNDKGNGWADMTLVGCAEKYYAANVPVGYSNLQFVRMNPAIKENKFQEGVSWNQTANLTLPTNGNNLYDLTKIYLKPNANWKKDGARFAAYFFNDSNNEWMSMLSTNENGVYYCDVPTAHLYNKVSFVRMNGQQSTNDWSYRLNQSNDIDLFNGSNYYSLQENKWGKNQYGNDDDGMDVIYSGKWTKLEMPTITINSNANGNVVVKTVSGKTITNGEKVSLGSEVIVTMTPNNGYKVQTATINGETIATGVQYTICQNTTINVTFEIKEEWYVIGVDDDWTTPQERFRFVDGQLEVELDSNVTANFKIAHMQGTTIKNRYGNQSFSITERDKILTRANGSGDHCKIATTYYGKYIFTWDAEHMNLTIAYPLNVGDYRLAYQDTQDNTLHVERVIKKCFTGDRLDTISFFVRHDKQPKLVLQQCETLTNGVGTWKTINNNITFTVGKTGVWNFVLQQTNTPEHSVQVLTGEDDIKPYEGEYYIRTKSAKDGWTYFRSDSHKMTYSSYADTHEPFSHYFCKWVSTTAEAAPKTKNVRYTIANDYGECISDTLAADPEDANPRIVTAANGDLPTDGANVRFGWDWDTNELHRAYIAGSTNETENTFLRLDNAKKLQNSNKNSITWIKFEDLQNWIYQVDVYASKDTKIDLTASYNDQVQYFKGGSEDGDERQLIVTTNDKYYKIRIIYDFKTNHLISAWLPGNETITTDEKLTADMMIIRRDQEQAEQLSFNPNTKQLDLKGTAYAVMTFTKDFIQNETYKERERSLYWVSFPFDVKISDVFGFGEYGEHWILQYYDGAERAKKGLFIDSGTYWKYITNTETILKKGVGYVLALDLNKVQFLHGVEDVSLYFPSTGEIGIIKGDGETTTMEVPAHQCTITHGAMDRTIYDSHWNLIGIPGFTDPGMIDVTDYDVFLKEDANLGFHYEFDLATNTYSVQSSTVAFKTMYSYLVQYHGRMEWNISAIDNTPAQIAARRNSNSNVPEKVSLRLEIAQNEQMIDQTFVQLQQEKATAEFDMNLDLTKIINSGANIYTLAGTNRIQTAGNTLPMNNATVPVGVVISKAGEYTFRMPDGTDGILVELIDYETNTTTNLLYDEYTVNLTKGTFENRFALFVRPNNTATSLENINGESTTNGKDVRKVLIDNILYIVRDGQIFDARGARVK